MPALHSQEGTTEAEGRHVRSPSLAPALVGEELQGGNLLMVTLCPTVQVGTWGAGVQGPGAGSHSRARELALAP